MWCIMRCFSWWKASLSVQLSVTIISSYLCLHHFERHKYGRLSCTLPLSKFPFTVISSLHILIQNKHSQSIHYFVSLEMYPPKTRLTKIPLLHRYMIHAAWNPAAISNYPRPISFTVYSNKKKVLGCWQTWIELWVTLIFTKMFALLISFLIFSPFYIHSQFRLPIYRGSWPQNLAMRHVFNCVSTW